MSRKDARDGLVRLGILTGLVLAARPAPAQSPALAAPQQGTSPIFASAQSLPSLVGSIDPLEQLARMGPQELDLLYQQGTVAAIPAGKVRGRVLSMAERPLAAPVSKASKLVWQGKVFRADDSTAVNRFFGVRIIRGNVYYGESWRDGRPALILDYRSTSLLYARNRDEMREVAPGVFLGLMYARTTPQPTFKMYFALQVP